MAQQESAQSGRSGGGSGSLWRLVLGLALLLAVGLGAFAYRDGGRDAGPGPVEPAEAGADAVLESVGEAAGRVVGDRADEAGAAVEPDEVAAGGGDAGGGAGGEVPGEAPAAAAAPTAPAGGWASPRAPSPVTPVPASERVAKPSAVRGIYVGGWGVGSANRFASLLRLADETEINAFVVDIKDVTGEVTHPTRVPLARQVGTDRELSIRDMRAALERLKEHGIYPIARIVVFKDPLLAGARPEWAIKRADGSTWTDDKGVAWVDAYNRDVWDYNIQLAREAVALGFSEIQWDYVRFPDAPGSYMREAVYTAREGRTREDAIREFLIHARDELADLDVPLTADVFGVTTSAGSDVGIGQLWEKMADVTDVLLPMVYPSHYPRGTWGFPNPNAAPYQIVKKALGHGVRRNAAIENAATIRPWIQAFSLGQPDYTPEYIRAQIDAVYDVGLTEWILWSPSARYTAEPLVSADGRTPWFMGQGEALYQGPPFADPVPEAPEGNGRRTPLGDPVGR